MYRWDDLREVQSGGGSDPLRTRYAARRTRSVPVSLSTSRSVRVEAEQLTRQYANRPIGVIRRLLAL